MLRTLLFLTTSHQQIGWCCSRGWEGTELGELTPADQRDVPYWMSSYSAYKAGERRKEDMFREMVFVFPGHYMWWSSAFLGMAKQQPAHG